VEIKSAKPVIDPAEWERLKENTTTRGYGYRSIRDDIYSKFGVRHAINEDKEVLVQYYPCTQEGQLVGLKVREHPKDFRSIGRTGAECELFMQFKFNRGGKYVVITEGECLLPETEVLTRSGWVSLNDYNQGEVMQGNGEFAHPVAKIFKPYSGKMVSYKSGSYQLDMTPEHNMIRVSKDGTLFKQKAGEKKNRHLNVPRTVKSNTTSDDLLTRIQVMLSADFTFRKEGDIYGVLKKERKIERAVYLLDLAGVRYSHTKDSRGYSSFFIHRGHGLNVSKEFSYERDLPFAATIIDEIVNWDGNAVQNRNQIEYSSVIEGNARFVQTCAHLCGYVSTVINRSRDKYSWYKVSVLFGKSESSVQNGFTEYDYNGYVACLTMPQGSLLVRQKGSISVTGNCDALAAYQMLSDYNRSKGWEYETACVSPTTGANSVKQIAANYKFFDSFDHVIVCYDNDKAGQDAIEQIVKVLPKGKVKIMRLAHKDANEYLEKNAERQFVSAFYEAEVYTPVGVLGSGQLYDRILGQAEVQKLPFPQFMAPLNDMFAGGLPLGHIINIAAGTGIGKTSFVNELIYFWIYNSPHMFGIVSMELDAGQYGEALLSRHLSRKLSLISNQELKMQVLTSPDVKEKANGLFYRNPEEGEHRFYLLDNRDGSIEEIQDTIEELVVSCGCRIIVLDPLQDILDGLSNEEQAVFMKWCKGIIKSHGCSLILINHMRKTSDGEHREEDIHGSSTIIKSASANILLSRDKEAEDPVERNTTRVKVTKNRICGLTGPAGEVYYDNETHTLHNKAVYFGG
jgi:RecA/RadA recombinase